MAVASARPYASLHLESRQITMPVPHHSVFYRPDALSIAVIVIIIVVVCGVAYLV